MSLVLVSSDLNVLLPVKNAQNDISEFSLQKSAGMHWVDNFQIHPEGLCIPSVAYTSEV